MNNVEIGGFLHLFNRHGYVLDFSTSSFDAFTLDSVGVALCGKYELSKGASLNAFCGEASEADVEKLLLDLFEYYEFHCVGNYGEDKYRGVYERCKQVYERERLEHI